MDDTTQIKSVATDSIDTPFLLLERDKFEHNVNRLQRRMESLGMNFRPHLKTLKSVEGVRLLLKDKHAAATVSTLREAETFAEAGYRNLLYAVGIVAHKLPRVVSMIKQGVDITVILDSTGQAQAISDASAQHAVSIPALIEIDCDGNRGGLLPDDPELTKIGGILERGPAQLRGVMAHAGGSYNASTPAGLAAAAENERQKTVSAAMRLRDAGLPCPCVSVGSTPTAFFAEKLDGVTEVRAGVYVFFDLMQAGLGVCRLDEIAISVVTTVIGARRDKGWLFVDAGWMALSQDRSTAKLPLDQGYGLVCRIDGSVIEDLIVTSTNQEHGILAIREGSSKTLPELPVGTQLRILPNHACATAAQFESYHVACNSHPESYLVWPRIQGW